MTPADPRWPLHRNWQLKSNQLLCRIASNLNGFNASLPADTAPDGARREEFFAEAGDGAGWGGNPAQVPLTAALEEAAPGFLAALQPLFAARGHSARESGARLRPQSQQTLRITIWLVFLFAVGVHLSSHWHPQNTGHEHAAAAVTERHGRMIRQVSGTLAICFALASLGLFVRHRKSRVEERDQDYRALTEVLRVQISWCVAGLGRTASASYLQRQRNELAWIRGAVSSLLLPARRWKLWFDGMSADLRLRLLTQVHKNWVAEQAGYFTAQSKKQAHFLHGWHQLGSVLALAGLIQVIALNAAGYAFSRASEEEPAVPLWSWSGIDALAGLAALVLLGLVGLFLSEWRQRTRAAGVAQPTGGRAQPFGRRARENWFPALLHLLEHALPAQHEPAFQTTAARNRRTRRIFLLHLWLALPFSLLLLAVIVSAAHHLPFLPDATSLTFIVSGICLLAGGLLVAWAERNLLSEQAYQYNAMAAFLTAAQERLKACLARASAARQAEWRAAREECPASTPVAAPSPSDFVEDQIRAAQELIHDLGKEALAENAEWLILHRSRPMEPVMAG